MNKSFKEKMFDLSLAEEIADISEQPQKPGTKQAFSELYQVLQNCTQSVRDRIPEKFLEFLRRNMDAQWKGGVDFSVGLNNMKLLQETKAMLALVYRDFVCTDEKRRELIEKERKEAEASGDYYEEESLRDLMNFSDALENT